LCLTRPTVASGSGFVSKVLDFVDNFVSSF